MTTYNLIQEQLFAMPLKRTVATKGPGQASEQPDDHKFDVLAEVPFNMSGYEMPDGIKYLTHLDHPHPTVGADVYVFPPDFEPFDQLLRVNHRTALKTDPRRQASEHSPDEVLYLEKGSSLILEEIGEREGKCVRVTLKNEINGRGVWWAFIGDDDDDGHIEIIGSEPDNKPTDTPTTNPEQRKEQRSWITRLVPGISALNMYDPVHAEKAPNIFWYELLHFDGSSFRCPENSDITIRLVNLAEDLQIIRNLFGNAAMTINSGYRDPVTNRRVGGASRSQHCQGRACDFTIAGHSPATVNYRVVNSVLADNGIASATSFTHYDNRGYRARWNYGF